MGSSHLSDIRPHHASSRRDFSSAKEPCSRPSLGLEVVESRPKAVETRGANSVLTTDAWSGGSVHWMIFYPWAAATQPIAAGLRACMSRSETGTTTPLCLGRRAMRQRRRILFDYGARRPEPVVGATRRPWCAFSAERRLVAEAGLSRCSRGMWRRTHGTPYPGAVPACWRRQKGWSAARLLGIRQGVGKAHLGQKWYLNLPATFQVVLVSQP
jgi:hypothetical protein